MRILLLCSAFNGLSQRAWIDLCAAGHDVSVRFAGDAAAIRADVADVDPDLIVCPFLRERVPTDVWRHYRTIIIHPGPVGDRGPSSLDWAITEGAAVWGVTALQAVEEMDAGPVWATRTFPVPDHPLRKSSLYNGPVADAAIAVIREVVAAAEDPSFSPGAVAATGSAIRGRPRPPMRQSDRAFSWSDPTERIVRRIRAADGSPGVRTTLGGHALSVFDAHVGPPHPGRPGTIVRRRHGAVLVRTGDGTVWIGHVRMRPAADTTPVKLPATVALAEHLQAVPELIDPPEAGDSAGLREIAYRRDGDLGILQFDFHNGAMSTAQCRRLHNALRRAAAADTRVLVIRGGETFSNGIHLHVIDAASTTALEAWRNIIAIDDVCREIITCTDQLVVASVGGNAGAGGVMLALGADHVLLRDGVVLNPHYRTMGLFGSEYWTYVLPRRVGHACAAALTTRCLPIGAADALRVGLVDRVVSGARARFEATVLRYAATLADRADYDRLLDAKRTARAADERRRPLDAYRVRELAEMSRDIFDDRNGFAAARRAFVTGRRPGSTPAHLRAATGWVAGPVAGRVVAAAPIGI